MSGGRVAFGSGEGSLCPAKRLLNRGAARQYRVMDAANPSATPTFANRTPLHIGTVGLIARDLDKLAGYYQNLLGLTVLERTPTVAKLGVNGVTLLDIEQRSNAKPDDQRTAGLYHTAFLMPTRQDHARWILHIAKNRVPITGASDHGVSEAFYLDDPEGNGIEVYNDRPQEQWLRQDGLIVMPTKQLDVEAMLREVEPTATYPAAPEGLRIGHIHLRVGNVEQAEQFYRGAVGLDLTRRRGGATFMSSGGYHHHVGANVWHSDGAGPRDQDRAGLAWFSMEAADRAALDATAARLKAAGAAVTDAPGGIEAADPWGTRVRFVKA
jgi:catechol 2,3-dioxygenase